MINNISDFIPLSINVKGRLLFFEKPAVMGVINLTSNSFYDGSRYQGEYEVLQITESMIASGAAIIDIGAASTKPGSDWVSANEEIQILKPYLKSLLKQFPDCIFSIDTYHSLTAIMAVEHGVALVNDISAGLIDTKMFQTVAQLGVPYVMMHMQGMPKTMQENPVYNNVLTDIIDFFTERVASARKAGIKDIIIDPGFGFGKSVEHNYTLLHHLDVFHMFGLPVLCGLSRKSMINKVLHTKPSEALNGTSVLNTLALLKNIHLLRVHDVLEAQQAIDLVTRYKLRS